MALPMSYEEIIGSNSYHVITANCITTTTILDKFTITAGQANVYGSTNGGGAHLNKQLADLQGTGFLW